MKWKCLIVLFVIAGFKTLNATDRVLLEKFMRNVFGRPPPPAPQSERWTPTCPNQVTIAWQLKPPYTFQTNATDDQPNVDGIFHQVLDFAFDKCCAFYKERKPILKYLTVASNTSARLQNIFNGDASLVFPIRHDQHDMYHSWDYINVIESPGVVLIQRKPWYSVERGADLFKALLGTWPIVVLSLLMSAWAGICIWMLVSL